MNEWVFMVKVLGRGSFFLSLSYSSKKLLRCENGAMDICCPWALSQAEVIVMVTVLSQADFLPAAPVYSWALSPQSRNLPLAGRQAAREGRTLTAGGDSRALSPCSPFQAPGNSVRARATMVSVTMGESVVFSPGPPLPSALFEV